MPRRKSSDTPKEVTKSFYKDLIRVEDYVKEYMELEEKFSIPANKLYDPHALANEIFKSTNFLDRAYRLHLTVKVEYEKKNIDLERERYEMYLIAVERVADLLRLAGANRKSITEKMVDGEAMKKERYVEIVNEIAENSAIIERCKSLVKCWEHRCISLQAYAKVQKG